MIEYININSNHPRHVLKNTVAEVAKRLSTLSSSKEIFNAAKGPEQEALRRAGYTEELVYQPEEVAAMGERARRVYAERFGFERSLKHYNELLLSLG